MCASRMTAAAAPARGRATAVPPHWEDLRAFVRCLEERGELRRITRRGRSGPGDHRDRAAGRCARGGPALLFEHVKGSRFPLLINTYATRRRMSWALGVADLDEHARAIGELVKSQPPAGLMDKIRMLPKLARVAAAMPQARCATAPCQEVVETDARSRQAARSSPPGPRTAARTSRCRW